MNDYEIRTLKIGIIMKGEPIFHESLTEIEIIDEAGGEFIEVCQNDCSKLRIDPYEWPTLKKGIEQMLKECRSHD